MIRINNGINTNSKTPHLHKGVDSPQRWENTGCFKLLGSRNHFKEAKYRPNQNIGENRASTMQICWKAWPPDEQAQTITEMHRIFLMLLSSHKTRIRVHRQTSQILCAHHPRRPPQPHKQLMFSVEVSKYVAKSSPTSGRLHKSWARPILENVEGKSVLTRSCTSTWYCDSFDRN